MNCPNCNGELTGARGILYCASSLCSAPFENAFGPMRSGQDVAPLRCPECQAKCKVVGQMRKFLHCTRAACNFVRPLGSGMEPEMPKAETTEAPAIVHWLDPRNGSLLCGAAVIGQASAKEFALVTCESCRKVPYPTVEPSASPMPVEQPNLPKPIPAKRVCNKCGTDLVLDKTDRCKACGKSQRGRKAAPTLAPASAPPEPVKPPKAKAPTPRPVASTREPTPHPAPAPIPVQKFQPPPSMQPSFPAADPLAAPVRPPPVSSAPPVTVPDHIMTEAEAKLQLPMLFDFGERGCKAYWAGNLRKRKYPRGAADRIAEQASKIGPQHREFLEGPLSRKIAGSGVSDNVLIIVGLAGIFMAQSAAVDAISDKWITESAIARGIDVNSPAWHAYLDGVGPYPGPANQPTEGPQTAAPAVNPAAANNGVARKRPKKRKL